MLPFDLENGVFLETANVLIPWGGLVSKIHQFGNGIATEMDRAISVDWFKEKCLGGLECDVHTMQILETPNPRAYHIYLPTLHWVRLQLKTTSEGSRADHFRETFFHLKSHLDNPHYYDADYGGLPALFWYLRDLKLSLRSDLGGDYLQIVIAHESVETEDLKKVADRITEVEGRGDLETYKAEALDGFLS